MIHWLKSHTLSLFLPLCAILALLAVLTPRLSCACIDLKKELEKDIATTQAEVAKLQSDIRREELSISEMKSENSVSTIKTSILEKQNLLATKAEELKKLKTNLKELDQYH